jgi:hypothetical protein
MTALWRELNRKWSEKQQAVINYIHEEHYEYRHELMNCYIGRIRHYGIHTSSPIEGLHARMKKWVRISTMDVDNVVRVLKQSLLDQHTAIVANIGNAQQRPPEYLTPAAWSLLPRDDINCHISHQGLLEG